MRVGGAVLSWCENSVNSQSLSSLLPSFPPLGLSKLPGLFLGAETEARQRNPPFEKNKTKQTTLQTLASDFLFLPCKRPPTIVHPQTGQGGNASFHSWDVARATVTVKEKGKRAAIGWATSPSSLPWYIKYRSHFNCSLDNSKPLSWGWAVGSLPIVWQCT